MIDKNYNKAMVDMQTLQSFENTARCAQHVKDEGGV